MLGLDFYLKYDKLIKKLLSKIIKKIKGTQDTFSIQKKGIGDKIIEELNKNNF